MTILKILLFTSCVLLASASFGQATAGTAVLSSQPSVLRTPSHPEHASGKSLADRQSLLGQGGYSSARGERPLWEVAPAPQYTPLGDLARQAKKQQEPSKRAAIVWENCIEKSAKVCQANRN